MKIFILLFFVLFSSATVFASSEAKIKCPYPWADRNLSIEQYQHKFKTWIGLVQHNEPEGYNNWLWARIQEKDVFSCSGDSAEEFYSFAVDYVAKYIAPLSTDQYITAFSCMCKISRTLDGCTLNTSFDTVKISCIRNKDTGIANIKLEANINKK